ncbi:MAG: tetratricopeptide repeat protein [Alphaproteobacteria bacterium]|nr:tetratricopeptide repeat protein [Alphaproteobacteria bacterium]
MPVLGAVLFALDIAMAFHAVKTGRFSPWFYVIIALPGIGALAYIIMVLIPEWSDSYQGQKTRARFNKALDPEGAYRALKTEVEIANTIANRAALAQECLALGRHDEAWAQYDTILGMHMGDEPEYMAGRARAEFGQGRFTDARATLDELRRRWPDWQSGDSHLLYARTLEKDGLLEEAVAEYRAVSNYYAGAEPRVRLGLALRALGRESEARDVLANVIRQMENAPRFARQTQAVWISMAQAALRG